MQNALSDFSVYRSDHQRLEPAPIDPSWIHNGAPEARNRVMARSRDGTAHTFLWECTAGSFTWRYHDDETLYVLEGEAVLLEGEAERRIAPGDLVFFAAGARVTWRIDSYIRKVAFVRRALPKAAVLPLKAYWRTAALLRRDR
jgi:uncharacterized cupin superfamily protein